MNHRCYFTIAAAAATVGLTVVFPHAVWAQQTPAPAPADTTKTTPPEAAPKGTMLPVQLNGQATLIMQHLSAFHSPYAGRFSLPSKNETEVSQTYTLYIGAQIRRNFQVYINPEETAGKGVGNALGTAGFLNGEVIRNPQLNREPYLGRYFARYLVATGKGEEPVNGGVNQVAGMQPTHRLVFTGGKLGVNDIFDVSSYADSARTQFMNWALLDNGAYDYAADTRGYSRGAAVEWVNPTYAVRLGSFQMPTVANGIDLANNLSHNHGDQIELELHPPVLSGKTPSVVRLLAYHNLAHMGNYREAIALGAATGTTPDITATRRTGARKVGYGINAEQALGDEGNTGVFVRYSQDDGATETFVYTEIDQHVSLGGQIGGARWHRPKDRFAAAFASNGLSSPHRDYLAAGGVGFIIGDGRLRYGREQIGESYYAFQVNPSLSLSLDYQRIVNPAYNKDRGPVNVVSLRTHFDF